MKSYHDTVPERTVDLPAREVTASRQDEQVLSLFKTYHGQELTPCTAWKLLGQVQPLTSIRRSITNLTNAKHLEKTGNRQKGVYGALVNTWRYRVEKPEQKGLF